MVIFDILPAFFLVILPDRDTVGTFQNSMWVSIILGNVEDGNQVVVQEDQVNWDKLNKISEKVGTGWKRLARNFEIKDEDIDNIVVGRDFPALQDKCRQVFKLIEKDKGSIGCRSLISILNNIEMRNLAKELETNLLVEESPEGSA